MVYEKFLIVASRQDKAGMNMVTNLSQFGKFDFYLVDKEIIRTENLDLERINQYDFVVFASKHVSKSGEKTLSVHAPGNFRSADFGGVSGKVCKSSAWFMKQMFEKVNENMLHYHLKDYQLTMEATHHGPLIDVPCVFVEIGPDEREWSDRRAGFVMARAISETIKNFKEDSYNEIAIAVGGPHYCPSFNKIQLKSNIAISHVMSQYVFPFTEEMIKEAIAKTDEEVDFILLDWKGLGTAEQRDKIVEILDKLYIRYKKTSDVDK